MKKLTITLLGDMTDQPGHYLPGDTLGGHVNLTTSASVKCSCVKIQFTGIVTVKIAKTSEEAYVLNQQVVVFGNANNATETVLGEGKHSWPFEFTIPLQHVPSSGKYRHGTVKFTLNATMISEGFMGLMTDLKTSRPVTVRDLINIRLQPYSDPVSIQGRSYIKPRSNNPTDLATATVHLSRSAYLKGQIMHIDIDLSHPANISRSPGCFIQLIRKEQYFAGDQAKEYSDVIATRAEALVVNSSMNTGKILAQVVIPDDAIPSMTTTKVILVEYHLNILFDMRHRTGLFEGRHDKKVNSKMRNKLLSSPGGFQIEVPVIVGTLSDSLHTQKPSPFVQRTVSEYAETGSIRHSPLSLHSPTPVGPLLTPSRSQFPPTPPQSELPSYTPRYTRDQEAIPPSSEAGRHVVATGSGHHPYLINPATYPTHRNRSRSEAPQFHTYPSSSTTTPVTSSHPSSNETIEKPLPSVPHGATSSHRTRVPQASGGSAMPSGAMQGTAQSPSARTTSARLGAPLWSPAAAPTPAPASSSFQAPMLPPRRASSAVDVSLGDNGYPLEKSAPAPQQPRNLPLPFTVMVEAPTAPRAVDLGLGPASPHIASAATPAVHSLARRLSAPSSPALGSTLGAAGAGDYFQYLPQHK
ncbi:Arrestin domain-containing protein 2 [Mortierella antarctica]|nr:Arrestin domain-containing protein 2 [Mortierella antarctica]